MKKIYKIMALVLVAVMLLSVCACGKEATKESKKSNDSIVGTWKSELDATKEIFGEFSSEFGDFTYDDGIMVTVCIEFNKDGTCTRFIDEKDTMKSLEKFIDALVDYVVDQAYEAAEAEGHSKEELDEEIQNRYNCTLEEYAKNSFTEMLDLEDLSNGHDECFYKIEDGEILFSYDEDDFDDASAWDFTLKGDKLTITDIEDPDDDYTGYYDFPIVFKR
ncbi:MAG: hypothetical protein MJ102_04720 [Clostridia bacterium]|nr:hypothetical protein [Clostridia bacterium]